MKKTLRAAAILTIRHPDNMSPKGKRAIAAWLRKQAVSVLMIPRLPVRATVTIGLLLILTSQGLSAATNPPPYDRKEWKHWARSEARPCGTVRDDALERDAETVTRAHGRTCGVKTGTWHDPYTGQLIKGTASSVVQLDHLIPLKWAHEHGGWEWSAERKAAYANEMRYARHLVATSVRANTQKGARGPEAWVPPERSAHCQYGESWATVIVIHGLTATPPVRAAIRELVKMCGQFGWDI